MYRRCEWCDTHGNRDEGWSCAGCSVYVHEACEKPSLVDSDGERWCEGCVWTCKERGCKAKGTRRCAACGWGWCEEHADMRDIRCGAPDCKGPCQGERCVECDDAEAEAEYRYFAARARPEAAR